MYHTYEYIILRTTCGHPSVLGSFSDTSGTQEAENVGAFAK